MSKTNFLFEEQDIQILSKLYTHEEIWRIGDLTAPYWRLMHNNSGIGELFFRKNIEKRRLSLPRGIIVLVPPRTEYSCSNSSPVDHLEVTFKVSGPPLSIKDPYITFPFEGELEELIEQLQESGDGYKPALSRQLVLKLLKNAAAATSIRPATSDERLNRSIVLMKQNPGRPLSNRYLAEESSMSVNGFARLFREKMGKTPYEYQMMLRIEKACILLQHSDKSIELIAEETGFTNRFHFSKTFKNLQNTTPVKFRKSKRQN